jgi:hypothetical protein
MKDNYNIIFRNKIHTSSSYSSSFFFDFSQLVHKGTPAIPPERRRKAEIIAIIPTP